MPRPALSVVRPTWVYLMNCSHGGLLYVGITYDLDRRIAEHRKNQDWWPEVEGIYAWQFPTRGLARRMELDVILYRQPLYNVEGVSEYDQYHADPLAGRRIGLPSRAIFPKEND